MSCLNFGMVFIALKSSKCIRSCNYKDKVDSNGDFGNKNKECSIITHQKDQKYNNNKKEEDSFFLLSTLIH